MMGRIALTACLLTACFGPSAPSGTPCDPQLGNCPSDQVCTAQAGNFVCLPPGSVTPDAPVAIDAAIDGPIALDATPPDAQTDFVFAATIAECTDPTAPDPAQCRAINGNDQLLVDGQDTTTTHPWHAFLRFATGSQLSGKTITSIKLRLTATDAADAMSPNSGEIWEVAAFTLAGLSTAEPTQVELLAPAQGPIVPLQTVDFVLPATIVKPNGNVFLGVFPTQNDGTNYWNNDGLTPPVLLVTTL